MLELPACPTCLDSRTRLRWRTAGWFFLGLALVFTPHFVAVATGLVRDHEAAFEDWRVFAAGAFLAGYPIHLALAAWQAKDRGGLGLALVASDTDSVTLVVSDAVAQRVQRQQ